MAGISRRETPAGIRWVVRIRLPDGSQRAKTFTTERDAKRYKTNVESSQDSGAYVDPRAGGVTFGEFANTWHSGRVGLAPSTLSRNRSYLDSYILPTFAKTPIARIDHDRVQQWVLGLEARGLSPSTISKAVAILRQIFTAAIKRRLIAFSPATALELPRPDQSASQMTVLTADQVHELVAEIPLFYRPMIATATQTGMRWGELVGLQVDAFDPLRRQIHVRTQLHEVDDRQWIDGTLKTASSHRTIDITPEVGHMIAEHTARFPNDHGLVFTGPEGGMLRRSNFHVRTFKPAAARIGVAELRFHDLRHTHASLLLSEGVPIPVVAARLGHKNSRVTMQTYAKLIPGDESLAVDAMSAMFATLPTTVEGWRGLSGDSDTDAKVIDFPESQS